MQNISQDERVRKFLKSAFKLVDVSRLSVNRYLTPAVQITDFAGTHTWEVLESATVTGVGNFATGVVPDNEL